MGEQLDSAMWSVGFFQLDGDGFLLRMSPGTSLRGKNHIEMPLDDQSRA